MDKQLADALDALEDMRARVNELETKAKEAQVVPQVPRARPKIKHSVFTGKESFDKWLSVLEIRCSAAGCSDEERRHWLLDLLDSDIVEWLAKSSGDMMNYADLVKKLRGQYDRTRSKAQLELELENRKLKDGETFAQLFMWIEVMSSKLEGDVAGEATLVNRFIRCLPQPYKDYIRDLPKDIVKKNDILDVVERRKFIFDSEKQKSITPKNGTNTTQTSDTTTMRTPAVNTISNKGAIKTHNDTQALKSQLGSIRKEITDTNRSILNIQAQLYHKRPRRIECWNCGKPGHLALLQKLQK